MLLSTIMAVISDDVQITLTDTGNEIKEKKDFTDKIDLQNLNHIAGGDEQFVKQMLTSFITTTDRLMKDMQEAVAGQRWESVADISHKILPPCRHIGAMDLYDLLKKIETATRKNDFTDSVEILTANALHEFETVSELLNAHIAKMG
jgi:HPt (histidine-containing phosphotransfer) domain-containing protein